MKLRTTFALLGLCLLLNACSNVVKAYAEIPRSADLSRKVQDLTIKAVDAKFINSVALVFLQSSRQNVADATPPGRMNSFYLQWFGKRVSEMMALNGLNAAYYGEIEKNNESSARVVKLSSEYDAILVFRPISYTVSKNRDGQVAIGGSTQYRASLYDTKLKLLLEFEDRISDTFYNSVAADNAAASWMSALIEARLFKKPDAGFRQPVYRTLFSSANGTKKNDGDPVIER